MYLHLRGYQLVVGNSKKAAVGRVHFELIRALRASHDGVWQVTFRSRALLPVLYWVFMLGFSRLASLIV